MAGPLYRAEIVATIACPKCRQPLLRTGHRDDGGAILLRCGNATCVNLDILFEASPLTVELAPFGTYCDGEPEDS